jgi:hypothetical protein
MMLDVLEATGLMMTGLLRILCNDPDATEPCEHEGTIILKLLAGLHGGISKRILSGCEIYFDARCAAIITASKLMPTPTEVLNDVGQHPVGIVFSNNNRPYLVLDVAYGINDPTTMQKIGNFTNLNLYAGDAHHPFNGAILGIVLPVPYNTKNKETIAQDFLDYVYQHRRSWHMQVEPPYPMVSPFHFINHGRGDSVDWRTGDRVRGYFVGAIVWQSPMEFCVDPLTNKIAGEHYHDE